MLTKGMIDVKFPSSLSVPQDITGSMFTLADIIQQLSSFELYFCCFAMFLVFFGYFYFLLHIACGIFSPFSTKTTVELMQPRTLQGFSVAIPFFGDGLY